ncbi:MAG: hypothetical protein ACREMI_13150, partial [Gemmatimonadales bacterium]
PRRFESDTTDIAERTNHDARPVQTQAPEHTEPPAPPPTPTRQPDNDAGESFWSKVKRGLTGGGGAA